MKSSKRPVSSDWEKEVQSSKQLNKTKAFWIKADGVAFIRQIINFPLRIIFTKKNWNIPGALCWPSTGSVRLASHRFISACFYESRSVFKNSLWALTFRSHLPFVNLIFACAQKNTHQDIYARSKVKFTLSLGSKRGAGKKGPAYRKMCCN